MTMRLLSSSTFVYPLPLDGLPRLPAGTDQVSRLLGRALSRYPSSYVVTLPRFGPVELSLARVAFVPGTIHPGRAGGFEPFQLHLADQPSVLFVEAAFALTAARWVLGTGPAVVLRPLARGERGVLGALIAACFQQICPGARVGLDRPSGTGASSDMLLELSIRVRLPTIGGTVVLHVPSAVLTDGAAGRAPPELPLTLAVELARTKLSARELAAAERGDAVVFDRDALDVGADSAPWPVRVRLGSVDAAATVDAQGGLTFLETFARKGLPMTLDTFKDENRHQTQPTSDLAATAPVEVVAELGRTTLRADEVAGLAKGSVLALGPRRGSAVTLLVGGRAWARGELVAVDQELGVRITELLAR